MFSMLCQAPLEYVFLWIEFVPLIPNVSLTEFWAHIIEISVPLLTTLCIISKLLLLLVILLELLNDVPFQCIYCKSVFSAISSIVTSLPKIALPFCQTIWTPPFPSEQIEGSKSTVPSSKTGCGVDHTSLSYIEYINMVLFSSVLFEALSMYVINILPFPKSSILGLQ